MLRISTRIGVPKEVKILEHRVGILPAGVRELTNDGHAVYVESNAGVGVGVSDDDYRTAGALVLGTAKEVFETAQLIVKIKEPQQQEYEMLRSDHVLFTYLHLAADPELAQALVQIGITAIAYETVTADDGSLPLLVPMSEVAGRLSVQAGANALLKVNGGRGVLLGGVPGVPPAKVLVVGGGVAGSHAIEMAVGLGADVTVVDRSVPQLKRIDALYGGHVRTVFSTKHAIDSLITEADLVIGAVLVAGAATPKLITEDHVKRMQHGAVVVDISIDQGGCFETSRPTTHSEPTYVVDGVVHYCVTNMPGAVPRTSTFALTNVTLSFVKQLANLGWREALGRDPHFAQGLNVHDGCINHKAIACELKCQYRAAADVVALPSVSEARQAYSV